MNAKDLKGKWALITGASSGIGREFAVLLASKGMNLVIAARRKERLEKMKDDLASRFGIEVCPVQVDLSTKDGAKALFESATENGRRISMLINNAGNGSYGHFSMHSWLEYSSTIQLNAVSLVELSFLFSNHMKSQQNQCYIANVASVAAFQPVPMFTVYAATKGFVRFFSEAMRYEFKESNISVSCICPGGTYTEFLENAGQKLGKTAHMGMMSASDVVNISLRGMLNRKNLIAPGLLNVVMYWVSNIIPTFLMMRLAYTVMSKTVQVTEKKGVALNS